MKGPRGTGVWIAALAMTYMVQMASWAQTIRLPGGITIGDPRQPGRPGNRPERPDPARVCPKAVEWVGVLQKEYPSVDLGRTMSTKLQQMAVPLFADDVFQRIFGPSYPKLSDVERRDFFRMYFIPCSNPRLYGPQMSALAVMNTPFNPGTAGMGPLAPGQLIPALSRLATARATLRADEQSLAAAVPTAETYDRAMALTAQRKDDLALVWPSEKLLFDSVVKDSVARSASVAMDAKIQPLLTAPASPQLAKQLRDAPRTYSTLFQAMSPDQRTALNGKLDERRTAVLRDLLPAQQARANGFPATRQGLDDGAEWFATYQSVFLEAPVIPEATSLAKSFVARREEILSKMAPQFKQKIEASQDPDALTSMYDEVFRLPDDRQAETYKELVAVRTARADLLNKRAEQARQAAEDKAEKAALARGEIVASSLKVNDLANAKVLRAIYVGDFAHASIARADIFFVDLFGGYLETFGQTCQSNLPADKVMMTVKECVQSQHWVNGYGMQTSPDTCVQWARRATGVYADPRAFAAKVNLEDASQRNAMRGILQTLATSDPISSTIGQAGNMVQAARSVAQDLPRLIAENGCGSKALARLQENMTRFANADDPVHIAGYSQETTKAPRAQELDARALADDLIRANAAGWLLNRYTGLDGAEVNGGLDSQGRPRHIHATYEQKGIANSASVDIAFVDGVPSCLYFDDDPGNCKAPSPSVVKRYEDGGYRQKTSR